MNNIYVTSHEISPLTMAVLAERDTKGEPITRIVEEDCEYVIDDSPTNVIDNACKFFGSSLKGRQEGIKEISGITHKAPIVIDPISGMYFFPTVSPSSPKCSWIAHSHIKKVRKAGRNQTEILLTNGRKLILNCSYGSVLNQLQRTAQYRYILDNRIKFLNHDLYQPERVAETLAEVPERSTRPSFESLD